jgi:phosphatidylglycerol lysyltransferase
LTLPTQVLRVIGSAVRHAIGRARRVDAAIWGSLLLLFVAVFLWREQAEAIRIIRVIRRADLKWMLLLLAAAFLMHLGFTLTQSMLLGRLGHRIPLGPAIVTYAERQSVATVLPFGGAPSLVLLARRFGRYGVTNDDAVLSVMLHGFLGYASFATVLVPGLIWLAIGEAVSFLSLVAAAILLAVVIVGTMVVARILAGSSAPPRFATRIPHRLQDFLASARDHQLSIRDLGLPFVLSLLCDLLGATCLYLALRAVGVQVSLTAAVAGYVIGTLFLLIAPVFQGIGVVEISMMLTLQHLGVPAAHALSATLLYRCGEAWLPVVLGIAFQARHQPRLLGSPARLPAIFTGINGIASILSIMPHPIHHSLYRQYRIDQYEFFDLHNASRSITLAIGMLLVLLSYGLWRRQRTAWLLAVAFTAMISLTHIGKGHDHLNALVAGLNLALLLMYQHRFRVRADRPTIRRGVGTLTATLGLALAYGIGSLWLLDRNQFGREFSLRTATIQTIDLYFSLDRAGLAPRTQYAHWLVTSFHLIGAMAIFIAALSLIRPYVWRHRTRPTERLRAKSMIEACGNTAEDFFKYADDKQFFFESSGVGVVSYGLSNGVALVLGDPTAPDDVSFRRTLDEFRDFADANGWHPAFYHATPNRLAAYRAAGLIPLRIGAEAIVDLDTFELSGKHNKAFRNVLHRFEREGYRVVSHEPPLPPNVLTTLRNISNEWLTLNGRRERSFTLGQFNDDYVAACPVLAVESATGDTVAFINIIPDGVPGEVTFDLMRHRVNAPNGTMDFLLLSLIDLSRSQGFHRMSLGMVPFVDVGTGPNAEIRERALALLTERFNRLFAARSLQQFKDKFHPTWEPRYLVYTSDAWLPVIGWAISRLTEEPGTPE